MHDSTTSELRHLFNSHSIKKFFFYTKYIFFHSRIIEKIIFAVIIDFSKIIYDDIYITKRSHYVLLCLQCSHFKM